MSETRILRAPRRMPVRITLRNYSFEHKTVLAAFTENFTQEQKVLRDIKKKAGMSYSCKGTLHSFNLQCKFWICENVGEGIFYSHFVTDWLT